MKIEVKATVQKEAKVLKVHLKCCDSFVATLVDDSGNTIKDYEGYVPDIMPGKHYGDYLILDIDVETGMILNWNKPDAEQLQKFVDGESDD